MKKNKIYGAAPRMYNDNYSSRAHSIYVVLVNNFRCCSHLLVRAFLKAGTH